MKFIILYFRLHESV